MKFTRKPVEVEVEAVRWTGDNANEMAAFMGHGFAIAGEGDGGYLLLVNTLEGPIRASIGDWVIKGVKGEFYPIKDAIFRETYESVIENAITGVGFARPDFQEAEAV